MKRLVIASAVEGRGEVAALPILLRRLLPNRNDRITVPITPIPFYADDLIGQVRKAVTNTPDWVRYIEKNLRPEVRKGNPVLAVVVLDGDQKPEKCARLLGPEICAMFKRHVSDIPLIVVIWENEFENLFLASHQWLLECGKLQPACPPPSLTKRGAKEWLESWAMEFYEPRQHQAEFTRHFDLEAASSADFGYGPEKNSLRRLRQKLHAWAAQAESNHLPPFSHGSAN